MFLLPDKIKYMKFTKHLFSILSIFVLIHSGYANEPVASIVFMEPVVENNISLVVNTNTSAEAYTKFIEIGGKHCLHVPFEAQGLPLQLLGKRHPL